MKLIVILFCAVTITTASNKIDLPLIKDLILGKTKTFGPIEAETLIGKLPPAYPYLTPEDERVIQNVQGLAEAARPYVANGFMKFPPFDPFRLDSIGPVPLTILEPLISGNLNLKDVVSTGARNYILDENIQIRLGDGHLYRIDANVTFPVFKLKADFDVDLLVQSLIPVQVAGKFSIHLNNFTVSLAVGAILTKQPRRPRDIFQINAVKVYATAEEVQLKVRINSSLLQLVENYLTVSDAFLSTLEDKVASIVAGFCVKEVNAILSTYPAPMIKTLFLA